MDKLKNVLAPRTSREGAREPQVGETVSMGSGNLGSEGSNTGKIEGSSHGTQSAGTGDKEYHPIYDQFAGNSPLRGAQGSTTTSGTGQNPPDSAKAFGPSATQSAKESDFRPDTAHDRPGYHGDEISNAGIKSGVIGFGPSGSKDHAALSHTPHLDQTQAQGATDLPDRTRTGQQQDSSHLGRDAAIGAGTAGAGAAAAHELHRQKDHDNLRDDPTREQSSGKDFTHQRSEEPIRDTDRSFPLAGGVTSRKEADPTSTTQSTSRNPITSEREPGTKEREAGVSEGHGREALAGAAAAYTGSQLGNKHHDSERNHPGENTSTAYTGSALGNKPHDAERNYPGEGAGLTALSPEVLRKEHEMRTGHDHHNQGAMAGASAAAAAAAHQHGQREPESRGLTSDSQTRGTDRTLLGEHNPDALAAAGAAAKQEHAADPALQGDRPSTASLAAAGAATNFIPREALFGHEHDHNGKGHNYSGDPCEETDERPSTGGPTFLDGPHMTDSANVYDPHLHVPGEFPETPAETPGARGMGAGGILGGTTTSQRGDPSTERSQVGVPTAKPEAEDKHHYGRDAAIAGGLGAAGLGAYEAKQHHHQDEEPALPKQSSPYSSSKIDPRVYGKTSGLEEQRFDPSGRTEPSPSASGQHHGRDAALGAGALGTGGLAGHELTKSRDHPQDTSALGSTQGTTQSQPPPPVFASQNDGQTEPKSEHHYGRDAGLAGAGAAAAGGAYYASQRGEKDSGPASSTIGPHSSNAANVMDPRVQPDPALQKQRETGPTSGDPASRIIGPHSSNVANVVDPRVQPDPSKQKQHVTSGPHQSDTLNRLDPKVDEKAQQPESQHHYGRDAAVAGGAGAAGLGAYEATKGHDEQSQHHPQTYGTDAAIAGGPGAADIGTYEAAKDKWYHEHRDLQPSTSMNEQRYDPTTQGQQAGSQAQHHYGRDAAIAGGAGAAGLGAYEATKGHDEHRSAQPSTGTTQQPYGSQSQSQQLPEEKEDHTKRNAALGAGALGAAGAGAYAYSAEQAKHDEKERLAQQKAQEKELAHQQKAQEKEAEHARKEQQKAQEKEMAHQQKEQQKAFDAKQKELEKQHAKEQKQHDKLVAAEEKTHEKEAAKEQERQRKLADEEERKRREKEALVAGGVGAVGAGAYAAHEHDKNDTQEEHENDEGEGEGKKKHRLFGFLHRNKNKDKDTSSSSPTGNSPRQSREYATSGAAAGAAAGGATAYEGSEHGSAHDRNRLHKDPPPGHPAREALEHQHQQGATGEHMGIDGPIGRRNEISGDHETGAGRYGAHAPGDQKHTIIEPHTGLPMNVEKYGDGEGGTDGSATVHGAHHQGLAQGQGSTTDWDAIKKGNTPY